MLYWSAAIVFFLVGAVALARPGLILDVRSRFRPPPQDADDAKGRRRATFGPREVRICGVVLLVIGAALVRSLSHAA